VTLEAKMDHAQDLSQQLLRYQQKHANWDPTHSQHHAERAHLNSAAAVTARSRLSHVTNLPKHTIEMPEDPVSNLVFHLASYNNDLNPLFETQDHAYWTADLPRPPQQLYQQSQVFDNAHFSSSLSLPPVQALMARTKQTSRSQPTIRQSTAHFDFPSQESAAVHFNWRSDIAGRSFGAPPPTPVPQPPSHNPFSTSYLDGNTAAGLDSPIVLDGPILKSQIEHATSTKKQRQPLFRDKPNDVITSATHNAMELVTQNDTRMLNQTVTRPQKPVSARLPQAGNYRGQGPTSYPTATILRLPHAATVPELTAARTFDLHIPQTRRRPGRKLGAQHEPSRVTGSDGIDPSSLEISSQVNRHSDLANVGDDELANYAARTTYPSLRRRTPGRTATHPVIGYLQPSHDFIFECGLAAETTPPKSSKDEGHRLSTVRQVKTVAAVEGGDVKQSNRARSTRSSARLTANESIIQNSAPDQIDSSMDLMPIDQIVDDNEASHHSPINVTEVDPIANKTVPPPAAATKGPTIIKLKFTKPSTANKVTKTRPSPSRAHKYSTRSRRHDSPQSDAALAAAIRESLKEKNKGKPKDQPAEKAVHLPIDSSAVEKALHLPNKASTTTAIHLPIKGSTTTASTIHAAPVPAMTVPGNEYGSNVRGWLNENVTPHVMEALKWVAVNEYVFP